MLPRTWRLQGRVLSPCCCEAGGLVVIWTWISSGITWTIVPGVHLMQAAASAKGKHHCVVCCLLPFLVNLTLNGLVDCGLPLPLEGQVSARCCPHNFCFVGVYPVEQLMAEKSRRSQNCGRASSVPELSLVPDSLCFSGIHTSSMAPLVEIGSSTNTDRK